jgi:hypothetical protein
MADLSKVGLSCQSYARLRWVGIVLFVCAAPAFIGTLFAVLSGQLAASRLLLAFGACALALAAFGTASDTALAMARDNPTEDFKVELALEESLRPEQLKALHTSPKMALLFPPATLLALSIVLSRLAALWMPQ